MNIAKFLYKKRNPTQNNIFEGESRVSFCCHSQRQKILDCVTRNQNQLPTTKLGKNKPYPGERRQIQVYVQQKGCFFKHSFTFRVKKVKNYLFTVRFGCLLLVKGVLSPISPLFGLWIHLIIINQTNHRASCIFRIYNIHGWLLQ